MTQSNEAAERSSHVVRGANHTEPSYGCPVVEVSPGAWQLRAVAERDAEIARLRELLPKAWEAGRDETLRGVGRATRGAPVGGSDGGTYVMRHMTNADWIALRALAPPPDLAEQLTREVQG